MAKHPKKRRSMRGYRKLPQSDSVAAGALTGEDVASTAFGGTVTEKRLFSSFKSTWSSRGGTIGEGPVDVGLAHSDYTAAEIEACLEAEASWDEGDLVAQELAQRKVRTVGTFPMNFEDEVLNDGRPIRTKLNWLIASGDTLQMWIRNRGGATLTTGLIILTDGHVNSWAR